MCICGRFQEETDEAAYTRLKVLSSRTLLLTPD